MNKKAGVLFEFTMTYGWAILVVLVAVGALAYFGILGPIKYTPETEKLNESCIIDIASDCVTMKVTKCYLTSDDIKEFKEEMKDECKIIDHII